MDTDFILWYIFLLWLLAWVYSLWSISLPSSKIIYRTYTIEQLLDKTTKQRHSFIWRKSWIQQIDRLPPSPWIVSVLIAFLQDASEQHLLLTLCSALFSTVKGNHTPTLSNNSGAPVWCNSDYTVTFDQVIWQGCATHLLP